MSQGSTKASSAEARETMRVLEELNEILNCGLDRESLGLLVALTEEGVNPEALAAVVKELRREAAAIRGDDSGVKR